MKTVREILQEYLKANGYDGLCDGWDCDCKIDNLLECGSAIPECKPGVLKQYTKERCPCKGQDSCSHLLIIPKTTEKVWVCSKCGSTPKDGGEWNLGRLNQAEHYHGTTNSWYVARLEERKTT